MYDVAIVGAGPGGSATAHFLAQRGLDVLLLDKSDFPRDKTCGDGLTPRALRVLSAMGLLPELTRLGCPITSYEVIAPNGWRTASPITSRPGALVIRRTILDNLILQRARQSGAHFKSSVTLEKLEVRGDAVAVRTNCETYMARRAVIATGAATGVLTRSGILHHQPRAMLAARGYTNNLPDGASFQLSFKNAPSPGYGWIFPVGNGVANIGVGFLPRKKGLTAQAALERFYPHVGDVRGYPIRVDFLTAPTHSPRTVLVGEAAGLVNPLTGEGIDYALESARIAADNLDDGAAYHAALHARFAKLFRFSEQVRDWYCVPPVLNMLVPLANRRPELRQLLTSIVLGEREPAGFGPLETLGRLLVHLALRKTARGGAQPL
jgi:geranylgeranyl reductase family protein